MEKKEKKSNKKKKLTKINLVIILGVIILSLGIFSKLSLFKSGSSEKLSLEKDYSKEEAILFIEQTPLNSRKNISKDIWIKSEILDELSYKVLFKHGTERPFTSELNNEKREGVYVSKGCGIEVFSSEHKFDSGTGWPSFTQPLNESNVILKEDYSFGIKRIEVLSKCGEHLGHVFNDGPIENGGLRWCINGAALTFIPKEEN